MKVAKIAKHIVASVNGLNRLKRIPITNGEKLIP